MSMKYLPTAIVNDVAAIFVFDRLIMFISHICVLQVDAACR